MSVLYPFLLNLDNISHPIYIYIEREREREEKRQKERKKERKEEN